MSAQFGRIAGPLLASNLLRDGTDLAFEDTLVFLSVADVNQPTKIVGVGINTDALADSKALTVNGTTGTTNLIVDTLFTTPRYSVSTDRIQTVLGAIYLQPNQATDPVIQASKFGTLNLRLSNKLIENITNNSDINLNPNGAGRVEFTTNKVNVDGDLHSTGDITFDGSITFGSDNTDNVAFSSDINSDIIPNQNEFFDLGTPDFNWNKLYSINVQSDTLTAPGLVTNNIDLLFTANKTLYVSVNGSDSNYGNHLHSTYRTVKYALSQASAGDEIVIFPGVYQEEFPLTIPAGVSVRGMGIRSVGIEPTLATNTNDAFLMNGETTVSFLTVQNFFYDSVNNTGYAFRFAPNISVTTRSPYMFHVSVITRGSITSPSDPLGFNSADAGGGAYLDGSVADLASPFLPTGLFFSATFITPNSVGVTATNKTRVEWLNSFTYYASTGVLLKTGTEGFANQGETRLTLSGVSGIVEVGDTFTYYNDAETEILGTGTVTAINGAVYSLDGFVGGLLTIDEIPATEFTPHGTPVISDSHIKFGSGSLYLNGSSYIDAPDTFKFTLGASPYCLEMWVYPLSFPTVESTFAAHWGVTDSEQAMKVALSDAGGVTVYIRTDSGLTTLTTGIEYLLDENGDIYIDEAGNPFISENSAIILNSWQHVAVVRDGDIVTLYINGFAKVSTTLPSGAIVNDGTGRAAIGYGLDGTETFNGYIDELRLSKNTTRFTSDFTVPSTEYDADFATFLLMHFNGVNGSINFIDESDILQNIQFTNATALHIDALDYKDFGAEMRSINSANVYGTYGAVADGRDTIAYLVGHNFGYIGSGLVNTNDRDLVIQANEVVEENYGVIYYDSVDHKGDYRVGNVFYVNQETGQVTFDAQSIDISAAGNITLEGPTSTTIIDATKVQTGNIRIHDNNVDSILGPVNWKAYSGFTYFDTNVNITGNINITNDIKVDGNVYLGNDIYDTITVVSQLSQDLLPDNVGGPFTLGKPGTVWDTLFVTDVNIDDVIDISNNTITTLTTNTDLVLEASGSGKIQVATTNVQIDNNLTVDGDTTVNGTSSLKDIEIRSETLTLTVTQVNQNLSGTSSPTGFFFYGWQILNPGQTEPTFSVIQPGWTVVGHPDWVVTVVGDGVTNYDITITGGSFASGGTYSFTGNVLSYSPNNVTIVGDFNQTGNAYITGTFANNNIEILGDSYFKVNNINLYDNTITGLTADTNLVLTANGTGGIILDNRLKIVDNIISNVWTSPTTDTQKSIIFDPNGTGNVEITGTKSLVVPSGNTSTRTIAANGELRFNNQSLTLEGYQAGGIANLNELRSTDRFTYITAELTPGTNDNTLRFATNNIVRAQITPTALVTNTVHVDNVSISGNTISNLVTANDLEIPTDGTRSIIINSIPVKDNAITNPTNSVFTIASTGPGYVKFDGVGGVVFPYGPSVDRRPTPEIGEIRNNSTVGYMEVYCGDPLQGDNGWIAAVGTQGAASLAFIEESMDIWSLVLG